MFDDLDPTGVLADVVRADPEALSDADLLEAVRVARSVTAASQGLLLTAVAELRQRAQLEHDRWLAGRQGRRLTRAERGSAPAGPDEVDRFAAAEVALALGVPQGTAMATQALAVDLTTRLPRTLGALVAGRLDRPHAEAIAEAAVGLDGEGCAALEADLLPRVVPSDSVELVEVPGAVDERGLPLVVLGGPAREGAVVCGFTRAQVAGRVRRTVMRIDRSAARRRAEAARSCRDVRAWGAEDGMGVLQVTGPAATVAAAWARVDAIARDKQDRARAALRRLQHEVPDADAGTAKDNDTATGAADPVESLPTLDNLRADTVLELLVGSHDLRDLPSPHVQVHVDITVPLQSLAEADAGGSSGAVATPSCAEPAEVVGMGPITVEEARDLLADARWRMLVPAPVPGPVSGARSGSEAGAAPGPCRTHQASGPGPYALPARLTRAVRARDVTCRFPGCRRAARRCDIDHTVPHPRGPSALCNNACLCRFHHRVKHRAGWHVEQLPGGVMRWTSPSGATATTRPPPALDPSSPTADRSSGIPPLGAGPPGAALPRAAPPGAFLGSAAPYVPAPA